MTEEQLLAHAARCSRLAQLCLDPHIARKLQALAQDYRRFAERSAASSAARPERQYEPAVIEPGQRRKGAAA